LSRMQGATNEHTLWSVSEEQCGGRFKDGPPPGGLAAFGLRLRGIPLKYV